MRHLNKRGGWADKALDFLLAIVVALVLLLFIRMYLWDSASNSISSAQSCGALTGSRGECKTSCDTNLEMEFENMGCSKKEKCCVLIDADIRDVILPRPYGGNADYDFDVTDIKITDTRTCQYESTPDGQNENTIICKPKLSYRLPIQIDVINTGQNTVEVLGVPVVVLSGNTDTVKPVGTYTSEDKVELPSGGQGTVEVEIAISSSETAEGNYITIYPYAKCEIRQCKKTDEKSRGILEKMPDDSEDYITIKFVTTTT